MAIPDTKTLQYYATQGTLSDIGKYTPQAVALPNDLSTLAEIVQHIILHDMWIDRYGVTPNPSQWCSEQTPDMEDLLDTVTSIDNAGPFVRRAPGERVLACCREFATMLCGILRAKGIPARARCGFAKYLAWEGKYEDHWMCEVWVGESWQRIDPQIDDFQLKTIQNYAKEHEELGKDYRIMLMELDPLRLKPSDFMIAGEAWQRCRNGELSPNLFGITTDLSKYAIHESYGLWFIRGNLIRDFLALNKIELLPFAEGLDKSTTYWDEWPIMQPDTGTMSDKDFELLDTIARLTLDPGTNHTQIQQLYTDTRALHPPRSILA